MLLVTLIDPFDQPCQLPGFTHNLVRMPNQGTYARKMVGALILAMDRKGKKERIGRIKEHCWVSGPGITEYI